MSDEPANEVETEAAETVAPGSVENSNPSNADILAKLTDIESLLTQTVAAAGEHGAPAPADAVAGEVTEPDNNEIIRDKSPASTPWTHKKVLR